MVFNKKIIMNLKWEKLGRPFNPTKIKNISWMQEFAQAPSVIIFDYFVRVYISSRPKRDSNGQYKSYTGFVDLDRNNLLSVLRFSEKPILEHGGPGMFDEFGIYPTSVIKHKNKYLAYYGGWTRCESVPFNVAIGCATSDDGEHFEKVGDGPTLSYSLNEPFVISGPKIREFKKGKLELFYITGSKWLYNNGKPEPIYHIRHAESFDDGITWEKSNKDIIPTKLNPYECQASPDVIYKNDKYHMFFCYRDPLKRNYRVGYAQATDTNHWIRNDDIAGIDISKNGFDSEMIAYPHVFELDGKIYMMYLGNEVGKYGFGLAVLEGDL